MLVYRYHEWSESLTHQAADGQVGDRGCFKSQIGFLRYLLNHLVTISWRKYWFDLTKDRDYARIRVCEDGSSSFER